MDPGPFPSRASKHEIRNLALLTWTLWEGDVGQSLHPQSLFGNTLIEADRRAFEEFLAEGKDGARERG